MLNQFSRTQLLLGAEAMEKLKGAHVAVFGIGGVGGYVCEALVRSGVGAFDLVDDDKVCLTNLNRQIIATRKTIGKYKVEVMRDRILEINPDCDVRVHQCFYLPETADQFDFSTYDYVVDAVDTVTHDLISGFLKHIRIGVLGLCCLQRVVSLKSTQLNPYPCTDSGCENGSRKDSDGDPASAFSFSVFCFILLKIPDFCSVLLFFSVFSVHFHSPYVLFGLIFCRPFGRSLIPL